jgi:hypothetical protein
MLNFRQPNCCLKLVFANTLLCHSFLLQHFGEYEDLYLENIATTPYAEIPFIPVEGVSELATVSNVCTWLIMRFINLSFMQVYINR